MLEHLHTDDAIVPRSVLVIVECRDQREAEPPALAQPCLAVADLKLVDLDTEGLDRR